jgi:hypothetical protein
MDIEALSGAATIALLGSMLFALAGRTWIALGRVSASRMPFAHRLLAEAAQRFRDEFDLLGQKQAVLLASACVFVMLFAISWLSGLARLLSGAETYVLVTVAIIAALAFVYAIYRLAGIVVQRRRTGFQRAANITVGQELQKITGNLNRVFHDVPCHKGVVDHVLVGQQGVYAVHVIARRTGTHNKIRLTQNLLSFAPGRFSIALDSYAAVSDQLARSFGKLLRHPVSIRTVLVVPGWELEEQTSEHLLVVNENNLIMLRGWKDRSEYLLNEEAESLHEFLMQRCARSSPPHAHAVAAFSSSKAD